MTDFPDLHCLWEFAQTHVHWVSDALQPSHPLCTLLLPPSIFPSIRVFSNESGLCIRRPKYWRVIISPSNEYSGLISFRIDWFYLLTVQRAFKSLLQYHNSKASSLWCSAIFMVQLSHPYMTTGKTIALTIRTLVQKVMSLLFNMQSRFVTAFLPRSKHLLTLWLQSPSAVIWEPHCSSLTPSVPAPLVSLLFLEHPFHSHRAFAFAASSDWNALPLPCSLTSFRSLIVNDLIREAFPQHPM